MSPFNPAAFAKYAGLSRRRTPMDDADPVVPAGTSPEDLADADPVLDSEENPFSRELKRRRLVEFYGTEEKRAAERAAGSTPTIDTDTYLGGAQAVLNSLHDVGGSSSNMGGTTRSLSEPPAVPDRPIVPPPVIPDAPPAAVPMGSLEAQVAPGMPPAGPPARAAAAPVRIVPPPEIFSEPASTPATPAEEMTRTTATPPPLAPPPPLAAAPLSEPSSSPSPAPVRVVPPPELPMAPPSSAQGVPGSSFVNPAASTPLTTSFPPDGSKIEERVKRLPGEAFRAPEALIGGFVRGAAGVERGVASGLEYAGQMTGIEALESVGKWANEKIDASFMGQAEKSRGPVGTGSAEEASLYDDPTKVLSPTFLAAGIGEAGASMLPSLLVAGGAYNLVDRALKLGKVAATTAASVAGGAVGGAQEGIGLKRELEQRGWSPGDANKAATWYGVGAAALNGLSMASFLAKHTSNKALRVLANGAVEAVTEWLEEPTSASVQRVMGYIDDAEFWKQIRDGLDVLPSSFVTGMFGGESAQRITKKQIDLRLTPTDLAAIAEENLKRDTSASAPASESVQGKPAPAPVQPASPQAAPAAPPATATKDAKTPPIPYQFQFLSKRPKDKTGPVSPSPSSETKPAPVETNPVSVETKPAAGETAPAPGETTGRQTPIAPVSTPSPSSTPSETAEAPSSPSEAGPIEEDPRFAVARRVDRVASARRASNDGALTDFLKANIDDPELDSILGEALPDMFGPFEPSKAPVSEPRKDAAAPVEPVAEVRRMPASEVEMDPDRFQYKFEGIKEGRGVTGALDDVPWRDDLAGVLDVWRDPADGKTYVVNGHHRLDKARRSGVADVAVKYIAAPDAKSARKVGAEINIAGGRGTVLDAAKFFRDAGITTRADAKKTGLSLTEGKVDQGLSIARLSDPVFRQTIDGKLPVEYAADLGKKIDGPGRQARVVEQFGKDPEMNRHTFQELVNVAAFSDEMEGVSEDDSDQAMLDGMAGTVARSSAPEMAEVLAYIRGNLEKDKRVSGMLAVADNADRLERLGLGSADSLKAKDQKTASRALLDLFDKLAYRSGSSVLEAVRGAARRIIAGENETGTLVDRAAVKKETYEQVVETLRTVVAGDFESAFAGARVSTPEGVAGLHPREDRGGEGARPEDRTGDAQTGLDGLEGLTPADEDGGTGDLFGAEEPAARREETDDDLLLEAASSDHDETFRPPASRDAIDEAERRKVIRKGTADVARIILERDPSIDRGTAIEIADAVKIATDDLLTDEERASGEEIHVRGEAEIGEDRGLVSVTLRLYRGADPRDVIHEWYHGYHARLSAGDRKRFDDYAKEKGAKFTLDAKELFADEGAAWWLDRENRVVQPGKRWLEKIFGKAADAVARLEILMQDIKALEGVPRDIKQIYAGINDQDGVPRITPRFMGEMMMRIDRNAEIAVKRNGLPHVGGHADVATFSRAFVQAVRESEEDLRASTGNPGFTWFRDEMTDEEISDVFVQNLKRGWLPETAETAAPSERLQKLAKPVQYKNSEAHKAIEASRKEPAQTFTEKTTDLARTLWKNVTSPYQYLNDSADRARALMAVKNWEKRGNIAGDAAAAAVRKVLAPLENDRHAYDFFRHYVVVADLYHSRDRFGSGRPPFFGSVTELVDDFEDMRRQLQAPEMAGVRAALEARDRIWSDVRTSYVAAMKAIGAGDVAKAVTANPAYFRHKIIKDRAENRPGAPPKQIVKAPTKAGYLQYRTNDPAAPYVTEYVDAEFDVLRQMMNDMKTANFIGALKRDYDLSEDVNSEYANYLEGRVRAEMARLSGPTGAADRARAEEMLKDRKENDEFIRRATGYLGGIGANFAGIESSIPDGYRAYEIRDEKIMGSTFSIPAKVVADIMSRGFGKVEKGDLEQRSVMLGKHPPLILPNDIVAQLEATRSQETKPEGAKFAAEMLLKAPQRIFKRFALGSPERILKYRLRNTVGDAEAAAIINPNSFRYASRSARDLYAALVKGADPSPELVEFFERGGLDSMQHVQEAGDFGRLNEFANMFDDERGLTRKAWDKYWSGVKTFNDLGEGLLRYANYLSYKEQIQANGGKPKNYGVSQREHIDALESIEDKAYWLANDTMGAYDRLSYFGQTMRDYAVPFWSFQEANLRRAVGLIRNGYYRQAGVMIPLGVARDVAKLYVGSVGVQMLSLLLSGGDDDDVPENTRKKGAYAYLGRTAEETFNFSRLGNLSDLIEWVGFEHSPRVAAEFLTGKIDLTGAIDRLMDPYKKISSWKELPPISKLWSAANPAGYGKTVLELLLGESTFPSLSKKRPISDSVEHVVRSFALETPYRVATRLAGAIRSEVPQDIRWLLPAQKPMDLRKGWGGRGLDVAKELVLYAEENGKASYDEIRAEAGERARRSGTPAAIDPKSEALRRLKLALRYSDETAAKAAFVDYLWADGNVKSANESISKLHPLNAIAKKDRRAFVASLDEDGRRKLETAIRYYKERIAPGDLKRDLIRIWRDRDVQMEVKEIDRRNREKEKGTRENEKRVGKRRLDVLLEMANERR
jgi:hypothetical protein